MILLERVCEEALRQIFCVFVICLPLKANVFVSGFPIARQDGLESATAHDLVIAAGADDSGVICDRKLVKQTADVCILIHYCTGLQDLPVILSTSVSLQSPT